jgi:hypothetical protein
MMLLSLSSSFALQLVLVSSSLQTRKQKLAFGGCILRLSVRPPPCKRGGCRLAMRFPELVTCWFRFQWKWDWGWRAPVALKKIVSEIFQRNKKENIVVWV